jgi:hypothetical protein
LYLKKNCFISFKDEVKFTAEDQGAKKKQEEKQLRRNIQNEINDGKRELNAVEKKVNNLNEKPEAK